MLFFRFLLPLFVLTLAGLVIAYFVTKERRYLRYAGQVVMGVLVVVVAFGLLYVFERVLLL